MDGRRHARSRAAPRRRPAHLRAAVGRLHPLPVHAGLSARWSPSSARSSASATSSGASSRSPASSPSPCSATSTRAAKAARAPPRRAPSPSSSPPSSRRARSTIWRAPTRCSWASSPPACCVGWWKRQIVRRRRRRGAPARRRLLRQADGLAVHGRARPVAPARRAARRHRLRPHARRRRAAGAVDLATTPPTAGSGPTPPCSIASTTSSPRARSSARPAACALILGPAILLVPWALVAPPHAGPGLRDASSRSPASSPPASASARSGRSPTPSCPASCCRPSPSASPPAASSTIARASAAAPAPRRRLSPARAVDPDARRAASCPSSGASCPTSWHLERAAGADRLRSAHLHSHRAGSRRRRRAASRACAPPTATCSSRSTRSTRTSPASATYLHRMGVLDIWRAGMGAPRGLVEALDAHRFALVVMDDKIDGNWQMWPRLLARLPHRRHHRRPARGLRARRRCRAICSCRT